MVKLSAASVYNNLPLFTVNSHLIQDFAQALFREVSAVAYSRFYGDWHSGAAALDFARFINEVENSIKNQQEMCCLIGIHRCGWMSRENLNLKKYGKVLTHEDSFQVKLKMDVNPSNMLMYFFVLKYETKRERIQPRFVLQPVKI